jgi:hypothetical protein
MNITSAEVCDHRALLVAFCSEDPLPMRHRPVALLIGSAILAVMLGVSPVRGSP